MNRKFSICFLDTLGLLYTGDTVYKKGLGGSESAVIYMGEELTKLGFDVTVYNKCEQEGMYSGVEYIDIGKVRDEKRSFDILISLRSALPLVPQQHGWDIWNKFKKDIGPFTSIVENAKKKFIWMHDTFLEGEEWLEPLLLDGKIDEVFLLSDWHSHYVSQSDHWNTPKRDYAQLKHKIFQTRNGMKKYVNNVDINKKDPNLFIYNSSVTKGMIPLVEKVWPLVKKEIPNAKLIVIGGYYRGAGPNNTADEGEKKFFQLSEANEGQLDVHFTGVITQKEIANYLAQATWMIYPPDFPETYGISTLEAMNYNVIPLTSNFGALEEVALDQCSFKVHYNIFHDDMQVQRFVEMVVRAYNNPYLKQQKQYACNEIKQYSSWETVAVEWAYHFYRLHEEIVDREFTERARAITSNVNRIYNRRNVNPESRYESFNADKERKLVIISPVYNAEKYIDKCIKSVAAQLYNNYTHTIIDDMSTDRTLEVARATIAALPKNLADKFFIISNTKKENAISNQTKVISTQSENSIICLLDGDDWLRSDPDIFNFINEQYHNGAEMTYGSCWSLADQIPLIAQPYPEEVRLDKTYRNYSFSWGIPYTHLRTFSIELYDKIDLKSLKDENGKFFGAGGDGPFLYALLEAAEPNAIFCIQRLLVNYNDLNPLNDYKINGEEQNKVKNIGQRIFEKKNLIENLSDIHQKVLDRDDKAIEEYKFIVANRSDTWIDNLEVPTIKPRFEWLFKKFDELRISKDSKILDIGSWTGALANNFFKNGYKDITCFDIGEKVVETGKIAFPQFKWVCDDIETYQTDEKYDVIFMLEIIEHLVDPYKTIEKVKTFLNPNGKIFFTVPTEDTVFGEKEKEIGREHSGPEHISIVDQEKIKQITPYYEIIQSGFNKWYVGYVEKTKKIKILIGLPTAKYIESETFISIYNLIKPENCQVDFQCFFGYNVAQVRNLMADYSIKNDYDYMFWADSDMIFPKDTLVKLFSLQKDIVTGVYIQRKEEKIPEIYIPTLYGGMTNINVNEIIEDKILNVQGCGFGCVLTTTKCLSNIGYPQFEYTNALDHKNTISEDVDFCRKAQNKGYKIFADTSIKCNHIGQKYFSI